MDISELSPAQTLYLIEQSVEQGNLETLKQFLTLDYVNINTLTNLSGLNMLMVAAWKGQAHVVSFLLDQNVGLEMMDMEGKTALLFAAWGGHTEIVDLLLNRGANVHSTSRHGANAFILSLDCGNKETVFRLLAAMQDKDLSIYKRECMDILFEFEQKLMACRNKLTEIFHPIVFSQSGNITISSEQMQVLCQAFPAWYACLINQDLKCVCESLVNMKIAEQAKRQQGMIEQPIAPLVFLTAAHPVPVMPAPALFVPKRKPEDDIDQDRENKRRKKEEDAEMKEEPNSLGYQF